MSVFDEFMNMEVNNNEVAKNSDVGAGSAVYEQFIQEGEASTTTPAPDADIIQKTTNGEAFYLDVPTEQALEYNQQQNIERQRQRRLGDKVIGGAETGAALVTGATTGALAQVAGAIFNVAKEIAKGNYGDQEAMQRAAKAASDLSQSMSYAPKSEVGKEYLGDVAEAIAPIEAIAPAAGASIIGSSARAAIPVLKEATGTAAMATKRAARGGSSTSVARMADDVDTGTGTSATQQSVREATTDAPSQNTYQQVGDLVNRAARGDNQASRELADIADVDRSAIQSAERLDIDLPADIFARNEAVKQAAGLTRSRVASEASVDYVEKVKRAAQKADEALEEINGTPDIASVSERVRQSLTDTIDDIRIQERELYGTIDRAIARNERIEMPNLTQEINRITQEVGGADGLSSIERKLTRMLESAQDGGVTYGRLLREKNMMGESTRNRIARNPYGDMDTASLSRLYDAVRRDQRGAVSDRLGNDGAALMDNANRLTVRRKRLEESVIRGFGRDGNGSIAQALQTAINQGKKGNVRTLNQVLDIIPQNLRREALASAISAVSQTKRANQQGFSFTDYAKMYRGLRQNPIIYNRVVGEIGQESHRLLRDLYKVSQKVTEAQSNIIATGKANQALVNAMTAENFIRRVFQTSLGSAAATAAGAGAGGAGGAALSGYLASIIGKGGKNMIDAAGNLFSSDEFQAFATGTGKTSQLAQSKSFRRWARSIEGRKTIKKAIMSNPEAWIEASRAEAKTSNREKEETL